MTSLHVTMFIIGVLFLGPIASYTIIAVALIIKGVPSGSTTGDEDGGDES